MVIQHMIQYENTSQTEIMPLNLMATKDNFWYQIISGILRGLL